MSAQPPRFRPSALRVATHGQQVAPLWASYPSAEVQLVYSTAPADRTGREPPPKKNQSSTGLYPKSWRVNVKSQIWVYFTKY